MKPERRLLVIAAAAVLALLLLATAAVWMVAREPIYDGRPISEWIDDLAGPVNPVYGAVASEALPRLLQQTPGSEIVPALGATLRRGRTHFDRFHVWIHPRLPNRLAAAVRRPDPTRDTQLRYRAALILYYLGSDARSSVHKLIDSMNDPDDEVRRVVTNALGNMEAHPKVTAALRTALADSSDGVRRAALQSFSGLESNPVVVLEAAKLLADPAAGVRIDAAQLLKNLGPDAKPAIPALIHALDDRNDDVLRFAAQALGRIGPDARNAVPALLEAFQRNRPYTRTTIRWALRQIDPVTLETTR